MTSRLLALLLLATPALAQPEPKQVDGHAVIPMTLSPADYPRPALRLTLLPEYREMIPGNRVQMFLRCFMEQDNFFGKAETDRRQKWHELPLNELPLSDVKNYGGRLIASDMYDAARMTQVDWQLWYFIRRDGFNTLLPDAQKMRALADALKVRVRGEIAAGDFDGAVRTLKTMFSLGRTFEDHPAVIGNLVGIAISMMAANALEELVQQPGCPNLFWALTDLPSPFLDIRHGVSGERMFLTQEFDDLKSADTSPPDAAIMKKVDHFALLFKMDRGQDALEKVFTGPRAGLILKSKNPDSVQAARERLTKAGYKAAAWSPLHVIILDDVLTYEIHRDELCKWMNLPFWAAKPGMNEAGRAAKPDLDRGLFIRLLPSLEKVKNAQARLDQRLAVLRVIEGVRLHAHGNGGELPAKLADVKLPLPVDPVTGKPFEYEVKDGTATLHGAVIVAGDARFDRYYELRLRK